MDTVGTIQNECASLMQRTSVADFITATGADLFFFAINNARRWAEKAHDFRYSETDVLLSIASTGSNIAAAYADATVAVTGTLSPNVAGTWALAGTYNSLPFYTITVSTVQYFLSWNGSTAWTVTTAGFAIGSNYWTRATTSSSPAGAYTAHGTNTGTLTVTQTTGTVQVKSIQNVLLPVADGYFPIEFLSNDEWNERLAIQVGREIYNPAKTLAAFGIDTTNPVAIQQAQTIELTGAGQITFPITAKLSITRWLPDYTSTSDTDFIIQRAPDFMMWQTLLEVNKYFKVESPRTEGNLDETSLSAARDAAFQALVAWDISISAGTTTPQSI